MWEVRKWVGERRTFIGLAKYITFVNFFFGPPINILVIASKNFKETLWIVYHFPFLSLSLSKYFIYIAKYAALEMVKKKRKKEKKFTYTIQTTP